MSSQPDQFFRAQPQPQQQPQVFFQAKPRMFMFSWIGLCDESSASHCQSPAEYYPS